VPVSSTLTASASAVASLRVSAQPANPSLNHGARFRTTKPKATVRERAWGRYARRSFARGYLARLKELDQPKLNDVERMQRGRPLESARSYQSAYILTAAAELNPFDVLAGAGPAGSARGSISAGKRCRNNAQ
jgi:hypothetical protein